jgi:hypothetical protein
LPEPRKWAAASGLYRHDEALAIFEFVEDYGTYQVAHERSASSA